MLSLALQQWQMSWKAFNIDHENAWQNPHYLSCHNTRSNCYYMTALTESSKSVEIGTGFLSFINFLQSRIITTEAHKVLDCGYNGHPATVETLQHLSKNKIQKEVSAENWLEKLYCTIFAKEYKELSGQSFTDSISTEPYRLYQDILTVSGCGDAPLSMNTYS